MTEREMVDIPGGQFQMGSEEFYPDERPVHTRTVAPFRIDRYQVTNEDFAQFVDDTGYVTVAERPMNPADYPGVAAEDLVPGSLVFRPTAGPVNLQNWRQWWHWVPGAYWRAPHGPGSSLDGRARHPVVHVSFQDASAYASWAGGRLPTEAEFEFAARGGVDGARFAWGQDAYPGGVPQANTWIGRFPHENRGRFGPDAGSVGSYPANGYGLFDTIGNVWEWTTDEYAPRHPTPGAVPVCADGRANLLDARASGQQSDRTQPQRVLKGGSYLCSPDYCLRFRPAARSPQDVDSATTHIGFRLAADA